MVILIVLGFMFVAIMITSAVFKLAGKALGCLGGLLGFIFLIAMIAVGFSGCS